MSEVLATAIDPQEREAEGSLRPKTLPEFVGQPELKVIEDSDDGETRWIELRIPITEGERYRVGNVTVDDGTSACLVHGDPVPQSIVVTGQGGGAPPERIAHRPTAAPSPASPRPMLR